MINSNACFAYFNKIRGILGPQNTTGIVSSSCERKPPSIFEMVK